MAPSQLLQAQSANNSNGVLGFETSWLDQRAWKVTVATVLLAAIVVLRFAIADPTEPVLVLCVVPIALIAIEFGTIGGLAAATFCFCVALGYSLITGYGLGVVGLLSRAGSFYFVGALIGRFIEQRLGAGGAAHPVVRYGPRSLLHRGLRWLLQVREPRVERTFGYSSKENMSRPFVEFAQPDDRVRAILWLEGSSTPRTLRALLQVPEENGGRSVRSTSSPTFGP